MINSDKFTERLQKLMDYHNLSASAFADKVGVQRSSISHILSGRNKPSLEFIMKVLSSFQDVDLYWLLNGKGEFPELDDSSEIEESQSILHKNSSNDNAIERIVIFYKDGKFKSYNS